MHEVPLYGSLGAAGGAGSPRALEDLVQLAPNPRNSG